MPEYLIYLVAMAITPGPNTILSMANAAQVGLRKGIWLNVGMLAGITIDTVAAALAVGLLYAWLPQAEGILKLLGVLYLVWLAFRMLKLSVSEDEAGSAGLFRGLVLQLVNVKVLLLALTAVSSYAIPLSGSTAHFILLTAMVPITCFACGLVWALAGSALKKAFTAHRRLFSIIFAMALAWCALRIIIS